MLPPLFAVAACGGGAADPEVVIIRGADGVVWRDLTITGADLDVPDGTSLIIEIGMPDRAPERLGYATLTVDGGAFSITFPDVWEDSLYKKKVLLFDLDGDGACGEGDLVFADFSATVADTTLDAAAFPAGACTDYIADWPAE